MSYATLADVQALIPQRTFDAGSTPTVDQVLGFITNRSADLDSMLASRDYVVPVTGPSALAWCLTAVAFGAAADAEAAAVAIARQDDKETSRLGYLIGEWERMTNGLLMGSSVLPDAPKTSSVTGKARTRGGFDGSTPPWTSRKDAYAPSYGATGRQGAW